MLDKTKSGLMIGAGFLIGTLGLKVLTSAPAKKLYVQGVAKGLQAKSSYEEIIEEAKAQVDDIVAEATYINSQASEESCGCGCASEESVQEEKPAKAAAKKAKASK